MVDFPCQCHGVSGEGEVAKDGHDSKVLNISQSGAFIKGDQYKKGDKVQLSFQLLDKQYALTGTVMSVHPFNDAMGMGIQFKAPGLSLFSNIGLIFDLKKAGYKPVEGRS